MPHRPSPLPPALLGTTFTTGAAAPHGVTSKRLRSPDLDARIYGVRAPAGATEHLIGRCRAFATRLPPEVFFSHSTAARLLGAPLPLRLERITRVHVTVEAPTRAPHARGIWGHSRRVALGDVVEVSGLRVSAPERVWCEMAGVLDIPDLVVLTDYLIHHRRQLTTTTALADRLSFGDRISRSTRLKSALALCDDRAESRPESRLRVACVWAGLPAPSVNHEVIDTETGRGYRLDLAWPELKFAIEYQGDGHRTREQWRRDMSRRERLRIAGWTILELNSDDLRDHAALIHLIRAGLASR
jgi:hypothetical protein